MSKITKLSEVSDDSRFRTTTDALKDALLCVEEKDGAFAGDKILILALDTSDGQYHISYQRSNLSSSESIALARVAEARFLEDMNY